MFGYVIPDKMNMYIKDFTLFRAYYCGLCKALGKTGCQHTRFCTNYDSTFLNVLVHSLLNVEVEAKSQTCILSPLRKKSMIKVDEITLRIADVSVLLVYYNLSDDVIDGKRGRAIPKNMLRHRAKMATKKEPKIAELIKQSYLDLREKEKNNCDSVDEVSEPFAKLLSDVTAELVPDLDEISKRFCYNLGKLVYLFDALDDVEKDNKSNTFNPLTAAFGKCGSKSEFIEKHHDDIDFLLRMCYNQLVEDYNKMKITVSEGVLSNIVYLGLKMQLEKLLEGEEKCAKTRL
ncbi:MAG: DUF5685 family protein [Clostridia bacterium]|nr:DUF5685 family protein [Clostridia bacterium]